MSLPENLRRLRVTDGQSIEEIAEATGIAPAVLHAIENGRTRVAPRVLRALASHFRMREEELSR